jgi:hypothetical protein
MGNRALGGIEELTGFRAAEQSVRNIAAGRGKAEDALRIALAAVPYAGAKAVGRARRVADAPNDKSFTNRLYSSKIMGPEYKAQSDDLPEWAHRNIFSKAELDDIIQSGFMRSPAKGKKGDQKYFTVSDDPLPSPGNRSGIAVRVPTRAIPENDPVSSRFVEVWDNSTESFVPISKFAKGGSVKRRGK